MSQPALSTRVAKKKKLKASKAQREQVAQPLLIHNGMKARDCPPILLYVQEVVSYFV